MTTDDMFAIQQVVFRYGHILDDCADGAQSWDQLDEVFMPNAVFDLSALGHGEFVGLEAIIAAMDAGTHPTGHHVTNVVVRPATADVAIVASKLLVTLPDGRVCTGVYRDRIVRAPQGWRIERRSASIRMLDPGAELPGFAKRRAASTVF